MATYGLTGTGVVPFTGFTPTLGPGSATTPSTAGNVQFNGIDQNDFQIASYLNKQPGRDVRQLLRALVGAAPGASANAPYTRVRGVQALNDPMALGGMVQIEATNYVNRNTTAADATAIIAMLDRGHGPASYPADLSGNGGGGKTLW